MTTPNAYEELARLRKAERLALFLDKAEEMAGLTLTGDDIRGLPEIVWHLAAHSAKVHPPSDLTKEVVADMFDQRVGLHAVDPDTDPFAPFAKDTLENMTHPDERAGVQEMLS